MVIFEFDDFEARWYLRMQNGDGSPWDVPASGREIWRYYLAIEDKGDHEDKMILKGVSVLRALFFTPVLEQLQIEAILLPDCIVAYTAGKSKFRYTPAASGGQDTMDIETPSGWEFRVIIQKEGK